MSGLRRLVATLPAPVLNRLRGAYWRANWQRRRLRAMTTDTREATVEGITATFGVPTVQEYVWVADLHDEEGDVVADVIAELEDGDVFWDVGANIGLFSCFAAMAADVEVVAFEPYPPNRRKLRANLSHNSLSDRVVVSDRALGARERTARLHLSGEWDTMHSLVREGDRAETVPVARGDDVAADRGSPDVLKIDVEGAELAVLDGLAGSLPDCRTVYCEVHHDHADEAAVRERLRAVGTVSELRSTDTTTNLVARATDGRSDRRGVR